MVSGLCLSAVISPQLRGIAERGSGADGRRHTRASSQVDLNLVVSPFERK